MTDAQIQGAIDAFSGAAAFDAERIATLSSEYQTIVSSLVKSDLPAAIRAQLLSIVAAYGPKFQRSLVKSTMEALVQILAEESGHESSNNLLVKTINALLDMCRNTTVKQEDMVRVAADLFVQVIVNVEGYDEAVRAAADRGLEALTKLSFGGVVKKLLHLLSDDREKDTSEQLEAERAFALQRLHQLASPSFVSLWSEETVTLLAIVCTTVTAVELEQVLEIASMLPAVKQTGGKVMLEALLKSRGDPLRLYESLCMVAPIVAPTVVTDAVMERLLPAFNPPPTKSKKSVTDEEKSIFIFKAFVLACRTAQPETNVKAVSLLFEQLEKIIPKSVDAGKPLSAALPSNVTQLEALLFALAHCSSRCGQSVAKRLTSEESKELVARLASAYDAARHYHKVLKFYLLKNGKTPPQGATDDEYILAMQALVCLSNTLALLGPLTTVHLPNAAALTPSWEKMCSSAPLGMKRARE